MIDSKIKKAPVVYTPKPFIQNEPLHVILISIIKDFPGF
jgi:hypothetical protein